MGNHYHLVVETPHADISSGMQELNGRYAQRFNRRYARRGHLFEERFHSVLVEEEGHALSLCRYVVLNPVRAGLCLRPGDWRWSSYAATAGDTPQPAFLSTAWVLGQLADDAPRARVLYRALVADG
jgi:hypothetical protein